MQAAATNKDFALTGLPSHKNRYSVLLNANRQGALYQQIAHELRNDARRKEKLGRFGDRLVALARHAYTFRQMDVVEQASQMLMNLPLSQPYRNVGLYYHSFFLRNNGQRKAARGLLRRLTDTVSDVYKGEVIMSLAGLLFNDGDYQTALSLYVEGNRAALDRNHPDWFTALASQRMIAVFKSLNGNHRGALADLQKLFPLARAMGATHPPVFYDYLNSLSVEYGETGHLEEASRVCQVVLASPYVKAYPEWHETGREIALKRYCSPRSVVSLSHHQPVNQDNVLRLLVPGGRDDLLAANAPVAPAQPPARILNYVEFIRKMARKQPRKEPKPSPTEKPTSCGKTEKELFFELMELLSHRHFDAEQLSTLLEFAERISSPPDAERPNE